MKKDMMYFTQEIEKQRAQSRRLKPGNSVYGSNVMPILQMYKDLSDFEDRKHFREALESLLIDSDPAKRQFAVDICLGFFVFRDSI